MPIRPEQKHRYPPTWPEISRRIRERAGQRCEWSGCGAPNGVVVLRLIADPETWTTNLAAERNPDPADWRPVKIVLTVAHKDHTPEHVDDDNLVALCQLHHLRLDKAHHAETARVTRESRSGQRRLFPR